MPHRDTSLPTPSDTAAQELSAVLLDLLGPVDWSIRFRKHCGWAVPGLVAVALLWAWSSKQTLKERLAQALRCARFGQLLVPLAPSYQAFLKLLVRWTKELRARLQRRFQHLMETEFPDSFRLHRYVVLAADGSKLRLARTLSNEKRYSPTKARRKRKKHRPTSRAQRRARSRQAQARQARAKKADSPQMALTLLHHVGLRLPWDWRWGPSATDERQHLREMIPNLPADALVTADCGFVGYDFWSELLQSGRQFVIRVGGNVRLLKGLGVVRESQGVVYLWPDQAAKRRQPPLRLRLVVVQGGRQPWYLVTSVLGPGRLTDRAVAEIYRRRWRIELFFRHFKQTYGRAKLRSQKAEHAECEAEWSLMGLWAVLLQAQRQLPRPESERLSVAGVLSAFGRAIDEPTCCLEEGQSLAARLERALLDPYRRRNKTSRNYPRKKYEPLAGAPKIRPATKEQRQQAKEWLQPVERLTA